MTTPAAITASFSDYRRVKGRKVGQLVFEVPLEQFQAAIAALGGEPAAVEERWVAIALLDPKIVNPPPARRGTSAGGDHNGEKEPPQASPADAGKPRKSFDELPASQQAAMLCNEPRFWRYVAETYSQELDELRARFREDGAAVAQFVRDACMVNSRSQIGDFETASGRRWQSLRSEYEAWKRL